MSSLKFPHFGGLLVVANLFLQALAVRGSEIVDWAHYGGHTYYLLSASTWTDAEADALRLGGHLATVNDAAENQFITERFGPVAVADAAGGASVSLWIGLSDVENEGAFAWVSGEALSYTPWADAQPEGIHADEDYVGIYADGTDVGLWHDIVFDGRLGDVCYAVVEVDSLEVLTVEPPSGILSWWPAENAAWDVVGPAGGSMRNASRLGQDAYAPGKVGRAFFFDGVDDYVDAADAPGLDLTGELTIEAWIRHDGSSGERGIVSKRNADNNDVSYTLFLREGTLYFASREGGNAFVEGSGPSVPADQWTHVAVTLSGTELQFYRDGQSTGQVHFPGTRPDTLGSVTIGGTVTAANPPNDPDGPFSGYIDELSLYNRALSPAEIDAIFWVGQGGKNRHDPARDFSEVENPNAPWAFGWLAHGNLDPADLDDPTESEGDLYPAPAYDDGSTMRSYAPVGGGLPAVALNTSQTDRRTVTGAGGYTIDYSPRQLGLHPSPDGKSSVIRWTAREAGRYAVSATFTGLDARPTSTNVHIRHNDTSVFPVDAEPNFLNSFLGDGLSATREVNVLMGDTVAWIVDYSGDFSFDSTGVVASMTLLESAGTIENPTWQDPISTAEPPMTGRNWRFHARNESRPNQPTMTARIQFSPTPHLPGSWIDLPGGEMTPSGSLRFILDISNLPVGSFAFRIATTVEGIGTTYSEPTEIYDILEAAPHIETEVDVFSGSDPSGDTTHRGDTLAYTVRFRNSGAAPMGNVRVRLRNPYYTSGQNDAYLTRLTTGTTPGGKQVAAGDHFVWEWPVDVVRPAGETLVGEVDNVEQVVKKKGKRVTTWPSTIFTVPNETAHGYENDDLVRLAPFGTLPLFSGLSADETYKVVSAKAHSFQLRRANGTLVHLPAMKGQRRSLEITRVSEWQQRTVVFKVFDPTHAQEQAQADAGLPLINPEGSMISTNGRILEGSAGTTILSSEDAGVTTVVNPLRLAVERSFESGTVKQGGFVYFDLTVKNESSLRLGGATLVVKAPEGLAIQAGGSHPVFLGTDGQPSGSPVDAATGRQVVRPRDWSSNPRLIEAEIPGADPDDVPGFEQQAQFYFGSLDPGMTREVRVTFRLQFDWDTDAQPTIEFYHGMLSGHLGVTERYRYCENAIEIDVEEASPGSGRPSLSMWITQDATGVLPTDPSVAAVASVDGLRTIPSTPGSNPSRRVDEIVYRVSYANFGHAPANHVRLWVPVPEGTEYVRDVRYRTEIRKRKGKKPKKVRIPYLVDSARILQGSEDLGITPEVRIVGGGTFLTCMVPYLEPYPTAGWSKTLEFRVRLKAGEPVGSRVEQTGALVTSRELYLWNGSFESLAAEVVPPAHLQYIFDESGAIDRDGQGNPTGFDVLSHRAVYSNSGGVSATGAGLRYDIPPGFTFRGARYINSLGAVVRTSGITAPSVGAGSGQVVFQIGTIAPNAGGIAEVLLDYDSNNLPDENSEPNALYRFQTSAAFTAFDDSNPLSAAPVSAPKAGVTSKSADLAEGSPVYQMITRGVVANSARTFVGVVAPSVAQPAEEITYRIVVGNHSSHGYNAGGFLYIRIPTGTTYVGSQVAGQFDGTVALLDQYVEPDSGTPAQLGIVNPAGIITHGIGLSGNSCVAIDFTVRIDPDRARDLIMLGPVYVHGDAGGSRTCSRTHTLIADTEDEISQLVFQGQVGGTAARSLGNAGVPESLFLNTQNSISRDSINMTFGGADMVTIPGHNLALIPLGGGRMVAAGGGNLIGQDGASVIQGNGAAMVAAGGGNIVAAGAGNLISIDVPGQGRLTGNSYFGQLPQMVAAGAGNMVAAGGMNLIQRQGLLGDAGTSLIGMDGATLIGLDGATLGTIHQTLAGFHGFRLPNSSLLAINANTGRMVAAGGGNLVGNSGNTLVGNSGNTMVAAGGGNLVAAGGLNLIPLSRMVAAGGGNMVAAGGGNMVAAGGGNMVAAGGGNMVAAGGGNAISVGAGMVAAGAGN